ncbi:S41 family peptidase [Luedemannella helvata]|uniref:S41 family peptidase n=1 Tax=Luedemannella helvata TaxID=349315 RepID=A0ABP4VQF9_9ACTN
MDTAAMIDATRTHLRERYVFPDVAEQIGDLLATRLAQGHYADAADERVLAARVTADLQAVNGDKHLRLIHHEQPLPEAEETFGYAEVAQLASRHAGGIGRVERLDGDVGYLELRPMLLPAAVSGDYIAAAMTLVAEARALILDLRGCVGGDPTGVTLLLSYLFDHEPTQLGSVYERELDRTVQSWTLPWVPGRRFGRDKPVYALVGPHTFSGGEAVAYDLQAVGRATVVGERTRGGAHPRVGVRLGPHLELTVPVARAIHPLTGTNWEGVGIIPDVEVASDDALATALAAV